MIRTTTLLLWLCAPAFADTARVYSGEHDDFTRLVVELPGTGDWTVGKTPMGYTFAARTDQQPVYDLSEVWDRIPRTRLQALGIDPDSGALQLALACQCHVFPFEYRPGVVVLDIKPGPAPTQSAFELPFYISGIGAVSSPPPTTMLSVEYDWLDQARNPDASASLVTDLPLHTGAVSLDPLRAELLEEISRAAAKGVIDMVLPGKPPDLPAVDSGELPWTQIRIGAPPDSNNPGIAAGAGGLMPDGGACAQDDVLALSEWGAGKLPHELIVEARTGLFGEFDVLDPDAVLHAVRLHLFLGFGAEAAQYSGLLTGNERPEEQAFLISMAKLVDGNPDPKSPFLGMLICDGTAALWAALAHSELPLGQDVNTDAVVRTFLALPSHLRTSLGSALAKKLLEHDDPEAARMIRNAVERTPETPAATVDLLDASADLHAGRTDAALERANEAVAEGGSGPDEMIALVEAHFQKTKPLPPDIATALQAFQAEVGEPERRAQLLRALALAQVLSGQTDAGFATAAQHGLALSDLLELAFQLADDDAFLRHAILPEDAEAAGLKSDVELGVATRLLGLGFADAALYWLDPVAPNDSADRRRIAAEAELARGDARRAVALLLDLAEPKDEILRAKALVQLGALAEARTAYLAAGLPEEAQRLTTWEGDWQGLKAEDAPLWSAAAAVVTPNPLQDAGPLARGAALLEDAAAARLAVDALLKGLASPVQ